MKASAAIEENLKKADNNNYVEAQQGIDQMINDIRTNKRARKEKVDNLVNDLELIRNKCSAQDYAHEGRKHMKKAWQGHEMQQA